MNNDLISREALKKDFEERNKACDKWIAKAKDKETKIRAEATKNFICEVIMTIDNAPAVDIKDKIAGAYNEGYMCGNKEAEKKERKGEWILNKDENPECPFCRHSFTYWGNFCGNCGAKMQKGKEQ